MAECIDSSGHCEYKKLIGWLFYAIDTAYKEDPNRIHEILANWKLEVNKASKAIENEKSVVKS